VYIPEHFQENDRHRLRRLIDGHPFGLLISVRDGAPFISHLPFLFDADVGALGRLTGHVARANPHWQYLADGRPAVAVFQGPHAYVSPAWYGAAGVPTWNYAVVHVHGQPRVIDDVAGVEHIVTRLTAVHESRYPAPWQPDLTGERRSRLLGGIVGFEIDVTGLEAKFKLSQNRGVDDQSRVIGQLRQSSEYAERAVAELMTQNLPKSGR